MKKIEIFFLKIKKYQNISFKRLNKKDKRRVKNSPNLLNNQSFITSRILLNNVKKRKICISHKKQCCVLVSAKGKFGVDIEELKQRNFLSVMDFCFNDKEKEFMKNSENFMLDFYKIYTSKEALLKMKNLGFDKIKQMDFFDTKIYKIHFIFGINLITIVYNN